MPKVQMRRSQMEGELQLCHELLGPGSTELVPAMKPEEFVPRPVLIRPLEEGDVSMTPGRVLDTEDDEEVL